MALVKKITITPVPALAFDPALLPFGIGAEVEFADVRALMQSADLFALGKEIPKPG